MPSKSVTLARWVIALILFNGVVTKGAAAPWSLGSEYTIDRWTTEQGLPQNTITSIAQTADGYLWLATFGGLVRFDGIRFTVFDAVNTPQLKSGRLRQLYEFGSGDLWISTEFGELIRLKDGLFENFEEGLPPDGVAGLALDKQGRLWAGNRVRGNLAIFDGARFREALTNPPVPIDSMFTLVGDADGGLWAGRGAEVVRVHPGAPERFPVRQGNDTLRVLALNRAQDGGIWFGTSHDVRKWRDNRWVDIRPSPEVIPTIACVIEDKQGTVWMGTWEQGILRFGGDKSFHRIKETEGQLLEPGRALFEQVRSIFEDREGNLWVGSNTGLFRLRKRSFQTFTVADGLPSNTIRAVVEDSEGNIWAAAGLVAVLPKGQKDGLWSLPAPSEWARTLYPASEGGVWIGTYGNGLYRWADCIVPSTNYSSTVYQTIFEDRDGRMWMGTAEALMALRDKTVFESSATNFWQKALERPLDLGVRLQAAIPVAPTGAIDVKSLVSDSKGTMYLGSNGSGLWKNEDGNWQRLSAEGDAPSQRIWSLHVDAEDVLWVGTYGAGLRRYKDGKFFNYNVSDIGLPDFVHGIVSDDHGHLWLASNRGIYKTELKGLHALAENGTDKPYVARFGVREGLGTGDCSEGGQPTVWKARDGRLWFATTVGLSVVDPERLPRNGLPPNVVVETMLADGKRVVPEGPGMPPGRLSAAPLSALAMRQDLKVPAGTTRVELFYTGLSLTAPEKLRFRYKLAGLDADWIAADTARSTHYSHLSPGGYTFEVQACNSEGMWSEAGARLAFTVLPFYWQTSWFRTGLAGVFIACIALASRAVAVRRYRRQVAALKQEQALQRERARIARDMHDQLGSTLTRLAHLTEMVGVEQAQQGHSSAAANKLSAAARATVQALDEIVWTVNPRNDTTESLAAYLTHHASEIFEGSRIRLRLEIPLDLPTHSLPPALRHSLLLVVREALNNVLKHSNATECRLSVRCAADVIEIGIMDDGAGFAPGDRAPRRGGNGLGNMRHRMEKMGGTFQIITVPGKGTQVTLKAPTAHEGQQ